MQGVIDPKIIQTLSLGFTVNFNRWRGGRLELFGCTRFYPVQLCLPTVVGSE